MNRSVTRSTSATRLVSLALLLAMLALAACGGAGGNPPGAEGPPGADASAAADGPPGADASAGGEAAASTVSEEPLPEVGQEGVLTIWSYLAPDDPSMVAYIAAFKEQNPGVEVNYTAFPEDSYQQKIGTALQAKSPPDVAIIENKGWMKAGLVVDLTTRLQDWGVDPADFNPGGMGRLTLNGDPSSGIFGVGDFLGGNILFYNKDLFDQAGLSYPPADASLSWAQYADICRKIGKPNSDPSQAVYGCSVPDWGFGIWSRWIFGPDGTKADGNLNSPAMVDAWNLGTALVRDGMAPNSNILETLPGAESDLFAQGKLGITWSDFTEAGKYTENNVNFGLAPFYVPEGAESFVDTWTSPWGTFTDSKNADLAFAFLKFIATDGQRIRVETSSDPPLSMKVAEELQYGQDDPVKKAYLTVLEQAKPQVFVPPLPEGAWEAGEVFRKMTAEGQTDAKPLLDEEAAKTQPLLDQAWQQWNTLGQ